MDYTNFVKNYYRTVLRKLNRFSSYRGEFANLNYQMSVSRENLLPSSPNFDALPEFELNISSNVNDFENYLEYMCENTPDLSPLALGKAGLKAFYEKQAIAETDDDKIMDKIDVFTDIVLNSLKENGVIK